MATFTINDSGIYYKEGNSICKYDNNKLVKSSDNVDMYESKLSLMELVTFGVKNCGEVVGLSKDMHNYVITIYDKNLIILDTILVKNRICKDIYTSGGFIILESNHKHDATALFYDSNNRFATEYNFTSVSSELSFDTEQSYIHGSQSFITIMEGKIKRMIQIPNNICYHYNVDKKSIGLDR